MGLAYRRYDAATGFIERTKPQSLATVAVKLRRVVAIVGAPSDHREMISLRQCVAFLERQIAFEGIGESFIRQRRSPFRARSRRRGCRDHAQSSEPPASANAPRL